MSSNGAIFNKGEKKAYEDIYNGLTDEERERMIKADIPKFEVVRQRELTPGEQENGEKNYFD